MLAYLVFSLRMADRVLMSGLSFAVFVLSALSVDVCGFVCGPTVLAFVHITDTVAVCRLSFAVLATVSTCVNTRDLFLACVKLP